MNLNQNFVKNRRNKRDFAFPVHNVRGLMGPPTGAPRRTTKKSTSLSSASRTNWGKSQHSVNNSTSFLQDTVNSAYNSEMESRLIMALTEGRGEARCEVGLASIDLSTPTMLLCQISDSQSYINILTKINILNPTDIIIPLTFLSGCNRLVETIRKKFPEIKIFGIPRKTFNKTNGMDRILQLCLPSINTICIGLQHKYYALAAASALTTYLQNNLNIYYAPGSLNIRYEESEGYAVIDVSTADRLELVASTKPNQASKYSTLFGVLNYCVTRVGMRLLRSAILQPPCLPEIIDKTTQCVTELIRHPQVLMSVQMILQKISNIDQLLALPSMHLTSNDNCSTRQLNYLLLLNSLADLIEPLKDIVNNLESDLFQELKATLDSDVFATISEKLRTTIHPSAYSAKSQAGVTQRCFAIKSDINGLLDLERKTYSERLNDLNEYVRYLGEKYKLSLTLGNNSVKGYHIVLKLNGQQKRTFKKSDLPAEFIQVYRLAASFTMKTEELINYSTRLEDIMVDILKISNSMILDLITDIKQYLGFFYKLCEDIARLDMVQSLAEASRRGGYVKPKFGPFTELKNSRHPMLELLIGEQSVANPVSICRDFNVQIITGPNGSGKSIYIRQVMLLQIMAQVGCYVPADSAIFRPMNRMFARIYLEDDMEYGASSFVLEMKEVKYLMTLLSENSLFIIDELCRSTAADEGAALAMAICEEFCKNKAFVYVTTHYTSLADLKEIYINVKTWQMKTIATGETPQELSLEFNYQLIEGVTSLKHYGVYIVKQIWPPCFLEDVYDILNNIKNTPRAKKMKGINAAIRLKHKLEADLRKTKAMGKLTKAVINKFLNDYHNELQKMNLDDIVEPVASRNNTVEHTENTTDTSYENVSNFIHENSGNIDMLIPEVTVLSSERELRFDATAEEAPEVLRFDATPEEPQIVWGENSHNFTQEEIEEIEAASIMLAEDDSGEFSFSQASCYQTASNSGPGPVETVEQQKPEHIFPIVHVEEGPNWVSSDSSQDTLNEESISYSPLCSQFTFVNDEETSKNNMTSASSSLPFLNKDEQFLANEPQSNNLTSVNSSLPFLAKSNQNFEQDEHFNDELDAQYTFVADEQQLTFKNDSTRTSSSGSKRFKRFKPPKKLTRKEIVDEFDRQDRKLYELYESGESLSQISKLLSQKHKRPSVQQIQRTKHLAFVRKTESGLEVIPASTEKPKFTIKRHLSDRPNIDLSFFSDKNATCFDAFINSEERDPKQFQFNFESSKKPRNEFNFEATPVFSQISNISRHSADLTPEIDNILNKYLDVDESNIFETCSLNEHDLDL